jgi:hypothetical protein
MKRKTNSAPPPYLSPEDLGARWQCHTVTARRRCKRLGVNALRLTKRSILYRVEDIARIEEEYFGRSPVPRF